MVEDNKSKLKLTSKNVTDGIFAIQRKTKCDFWDTLLNYLSKTQ
jgi:hypothetical protein